MSRVALCRRTRQICHNFGIFTPWVRNQAAIASTSSSHPGGVKRCQETSGPSKKKFEMSDQSEAQRGSGSASVAADTVQESKSNEENAEVK